jgi:type II secretory pathway pseudopilin PulG
MSMQSRLFLLVATGIALLAIVAGIASIDPPWIARKQRLDLRRQQDLVAIRNALNNFHRLNGKLPTTLSELGKSPETTVYGGLADPVTGGSYDYLPGADTSYQLCATFDLSHEGNAQVFGFSWRHPAGRYCFDLKTEK